MANALGVALPDGEPLTLPLALAGAVGEVEAEGASDGVRDAVRVDARVAAALVDAPPPPPFDLDDADGTGGGVLAAVTERVASAVLEDVGVACELRVMDGVPDALRVDVWVADCVLVLDRVPVGERVEDRLGVVEAAAVVKRTAAVKARRRWWRRGAIRGGTGEQRLGGDTQLATLSPLGVRAVSLGSGVRLQQSVSWIRRGFFSPRRGRPPIGSPRGSSATRARMPGRCIRI